MAKKITLPEVYKKDLKLICFLLVFGVSTYLSKQFGANDALSVIFGGTMNYIAYRAMKEAEGEGYIRALKK